MINYSSSRKLSKDDIHDLMPAESLPGLSKPTADIVRIEEVDKSEEHRPADDKSQNSADPTGHKPADGVRDQVHSPGDWVGMSGFPHLTPINP